MKVFRLDEGPEHPIRLEGRRWMPSESDQVHGMLLECYWNLTHALEGLAEIHQARSRLSQMN